MNRIKNTSVVRTYDDPAKTEIKIDSHWNQTDKITITIGEEKRTVVGSDLKMAIDNCMNVGF